MNTQKLEQKTLQVIDEYLKDLDHYSIEQLQQKPSEDSWSLGQVYIHLWMSAKGFFFKNAERCLNQENVERGKSKNFIGTIVFLFNKMPTIKVKMPDKVAVVPKQPESKEYIINKLLEIRQLSSEYIKRIPDSDPNLKTKHPFLGYLNAAEWIRLCNIHFRHHEAQKKRIRKQLGI